jgi:lipopolysaccharide export system permease protein
MRLLDRYLLRELLLPLTYCVLGFIVCFVIFDLFGTIDNFQDNKLTTPEIFEYYAHRIPEIVVTSYILPMSLLLALLYSLTNHARHHELTAMRSAGRSLARISAPYFIVGIIFAGTLFAVNETVVPYSAEAAEQVMRRHNTTGYKSAAEKVWKRQVMFVNPIDQRTWQIIGYNTESRVMFRPQLEWHLEDGSRLQLFAERGFWINRRWVFTNVEQFVYPPNVELPIKTIITSTNMPRMIETPRLIASEIKISELDSLRSLRKIQLSAGAIIDYLKLHPTLDEKRRDSLLTMLHSRIAAPWTCIVVVLIAVPFGALPGRRNVFVGVASSIFICFVYFVAKDLTLALGSGGHVPAWIAAWSPNAVFATAGVMMMWRFR